MASVPPELGGARVLRYAVIDPALHAPTGRTRHTVAGVAVGPFAGLAICQYAGDSRLFYLFYCDVAWNVVTDTCHLSLQEALDQATFEYAEMATAWKEPGAPDR